MVYIKQEEPEKAHKRIRKVQTRMIAVSIVLILDTACTAPVRRAAE